MSGAIPPMEPEPTPAVASAGAYLPGTNWTLPDTLLAFLGGLVAVFVAAIVVAAATGDETPSAAVLFGVFIPIQSVGVLATLWILQRRRRAVGNAGAAIVPSWAAAFGLRLRVQDSWVILAGAALQIAAAVLLTGLAALVGMDEPPEQSVSESLGDLSTLWPKVAAVVGVVVLAPLVEEIVFRGMLLSRLLRSMGHHAAIWTTGLVFALTHTVLDPSAWFAAIGLFPVGVVLGYLAWSTRDLSRAIFAHAGVNGLAAVALLTASSGDSALAAVATALSGLGG